MPQLLVHALWHKSAGAPKRRRAKHCVDQWDAVAHGLVCARTGAPFCFRDTCMSLTQNLQHLPFPIRLENEHVISASQVCAPNAGLRTEVSLALTAPLVSSQDLGRYLGLWPLWLRAELVIQLEKCARVQARTGTEPGGHCARRPGRRPRLFCIVCCIGRSRRELASRPSSQHLVRPCVTLFAMPRRL